MLELGFVVYPLYVLEHSPLAYRAPEFKLKLTALRTNIWRSRWNIVSKAEHPRKEYGDIDKLFRAIEPVLHPLNRSSISNR